MMTRRGLFLGMLVVFSAVLVARPAKRAPLEVTYYYLPG
jgi:hypothetical protein